ncbi:MAG: DUF4203 domain-containing protein [Nitriliruptor sp.]|nr:MAG: DUF4203 domain-containing protein [Nitriliruptor sp.]
MEDVAIGILAVLIGSLLCFRGYAALRVVIAVWGTFVGFLVGAGLVAGVTGEGLLASALAWTVGIAVAVLFGVLAYVYYAVSVIIGMGAIGFTLGTTVMVALGVTWSWVVVLVGLAAGVLLAILAIVGDLPLVILALLGAFAGASTIIAGLLLLFGVIERQDLAAPDTTAGLALGWWWTVGYVVLAIAGIAAQLRSAEARRGTLREDWAAV